MKRSGAFLLGFIRFALIAAACLALLAFKKGADNGSRFYCDGYTAK